MKSNGYGRAIQEIIILARRPEALQIVAALGADVEEANETALMTIKWHRLSNRRGDDDDVVFDLFTRLGPEINAQSWEIDWQASDY